MSIDDLQHPEAETRLDPFPYLAHAHRPGVKDFIESEGIVIGQITKPELLEIGYLMYNFVGDGQVPIIKPKDGDSTKQLVFLTREQLEQHKREYLPQGVTFEQLGEIEEDMSIFMRNVVQLTYINDLFNIDARHRGNSLQNYLTRFLSELKEEQYALQGINLDGKLDWESKEKIVITASSKIKTKYKIPNDIKVKGIPINKFERRGEGRNVFGYPCPCMDCNHIFPANDGIKFYDDGSITGIDIQVRMNVVTNHLAGHGINNNANDRVDRDHRYMTLKGYIEIFKRKDLDMEIDQIVKLDYTELEQEILLEMFRLALIELKIDGIPDKYLILKTKEMLFIS